MSDQTIEVFTDGACSGNPGPGGWAWAVSSGASGSGGDPMTTNQRMELQAVLEALRALPGRVAVYSDSTYVVNCFNDRWFEGWLKKDWKNSQRKPVANRDIWEPLIELYLEREHELEFVWVKGHSGDVMNDLVDEMAVAEATKLKEAEAAKAKEAGPSADDTAVPAGPEVPWPVDQAVAVSGVGELSGEQQEGLAESIEGLDPGFDILVSGLRRGTELMAAELAIKHGVPLAVVLPFENPAQRWPTPQREQFDRCLEAAHWVVTLDGDPAKPSTAVAKRDEWLWLSVVGVIVVGDETMANRLDEAGMGVIEVP